MGWLSWSYFNEYRNRCHQLQWPTVAGDNCTACFTDQALCRCGVCFFVPPLFDIPLVAALFSPVLFPGVLLPADVLRGQSKRFPGLMADRSPSSASGAVPTSLAKSSRLACGYMRLAKFVWLESVDASAKATVRYPSAARAAEVRR